MTKDDIIRAAFKVWGQDLYRTTSLSELARELGVSKPALYRHFKGKSALFSAMFSSFFDDCAGFIKNGYDHAVNTPDDREAHLIWLRTIAEYYLRHKDALVFSLIKVYDSRERMNFDKEFRGRGINFELLTLREHHPALYPQKMQLSTATLIFSVAHFHHSGSWDHSPDEDQVKLVLSKIEERITRGIGMDARRVAELDYLGLEQQATGMVYEETEDNALLKAVAEAVAEAGPWDASMEMVARRSGLSKSGLYAHFKNRQDMLARLFITEFTGIINSAKVQIETSQVFEDQLYLAIISIVDYLRTRPEILIALDWIKNWRLDLGKEVSGQLFRIIREIRLEAVREYDQHALVWLAQWIIFMIVNTLAWWPGNSSCPKSGESKAWAKNAAEIPNECFRVLFRFIALGLEGLNL